MTFQREAYTTLIINFFYFMNNDYHVGRWTQTHYLDWDIMYLNDFDAEGHL